MRKITIPTPPYHGKSCHRITQEGLLVGYIWIFTDKGAETIETQYATAKQIQEALGVSRATAYRIIKRHTKRYWLSDCRDTEKPSCYSVIPREALKHITIYPVGNPNFSSGIYQQDLARRLRRKKR